MGLCKAMITNSPTWRAHCSSKLRAEHVGDESWSQMDVEPSLATPSRLQCVGHEPMLWVR